eukprot:TRINITY_DN615_c0_g1_i2.p1 TRINITY_DN615_c0_g1~~TRINITY_DN615_c0_g1_i2.p1  ORF type:complete len:115 (-),score=21.16 TRINITY_DN615_c0_g1_i2:72-416(-)
MSTHPRHFRILCDFIKKTGFDKWYTDLMGYRKYGLHIEDLFAETPDVGKSLSRLPGEKLSDRDDRMKEALVLYSGGNILPKERWVKPEDDKPYLAPYLAYTVQERRDREAFRPR